MDTSLACDLLCIGNVSIDIFLSITHDDPRCKLNREARELCLQYNTKIPADDCSFLLGGCASNVSVGVLRLGFKSSLVAEIGDDDFSQKILKNLSKENVDTSLLIQTPDSFASFSVGLDYKKERVLFTKHFTRKHEFNLNSSQAQWVYLGSLGQEWKQAYARVLEYVQNSKAKLVFNAGSRQLEEPYATIAPIVAASDIIFLNKEEAGMMGNSKWEMVNSSEQQIKALLTKIKSLGSKLVVITDGANGSYSIDESGIMRSIECFPSQIIGKTGAGDGYVSGFLSATLYGKPIEQAMKWGAVNAAAVMEKLGAQEGLLRRQELEERLLRNQEFQAKELG